MFVDFARAGCQLGLVENSMDERRHFHGYPLSHLASDHPWPRPGGAGGLARGGRDGLPSVPYLRGVRCYLVSLDERHPVTCVEGSCRARQRLYYCRASHNHCGHRPPVDHVRQSSAAVSCLASRFDGAAKPCR
jgi:hypothetical protein